jgi:ethanolamine utilization protein EutP
MVKAMFIGPTSSGKTTLYQRLHDLPLEDAKTQALEFNGEIIDTPGEYLENRNYYSALLVTSMDVDVVVLLMDCTDTQTVFPPGFTRMFTRPTIGVVTKMDLLADEKESSYAESSLRLAGVDRVVKTSSFKSEGLDEFKEALAEEMLA